MSDRENTLSPQFIECYAAATHIVKEVEQVVVGKHKEIVLLMTTLLSGGHALIEDVPGTGKTTLAAAISKAAGLQFNRAQFTPDVMASDITGFNIYNRQTEGFEFRPGLVMCNILLADEINRASPKTQSALLEAMEEKQVTVDGVTYDIPDPFMVIATQNPAGYVGTYPLPEAQLDRFAVKLSMGYPTFDEEVAIIERRRQDNPLASVRAVADRATLSQMRAVVQEIKVDPTLYNYIVALTVATRSHPEVSLGASPRASLALMRMAQAYAFMHQRDYVLPEDVAIVYPYVISHRLVLKQEAKLNRRTPQAILREILHRTEVPYKGQK